MQNRTITYLVFALIGLSIIGVIGSLINDPFQFFKSIFFTALIIGIVFIVAKKLLFRNVNNSEAKAYKRAVRQSNKRYKQTTPKPKRRRKRQISEPTRKRSRTTHLKVIDGKKTNKKNQA